MQIVVQVCNREATLTCEVVMQMNFHVSLV